MTHCAGRGTTSRRGDSVKVMSWTWRACLLGVLVLVLGTGCSLGAALGVAVGVGALATIVATAGCYDAVEVTVRDAVTGMPNCNATVVARSASGSTTRFNSCFYAQVPTGKWTVRAERAGYRPATTELLVDDSKGCRPSLQTIEIWITPAIASQPTPPALAPDVAPPIAPATPAQPVAPAMPPASAAPPGPVPAAAPEGSTAPPPPEPAATGEFPVVPPVAPSPSSSPPSAAAPPPSVPTPAAPASSASPPPR